MKEIFLIPITKSEFKKIAKTQKIVIKNEIEYRESTYIMFFDKKSGESQVFSRVISSKIVESSEIIPKKAELELKLSLPVIIPGMLIVDVKNPPTYTTFEKIFNFINSEMKLELEDVVAKRESELLINGYMEQGINYSANNRLKDALDMFNHCLNIDYNNYQSHFHIANIYMDFGIIDLSIYHYFRALILNKRYVPSLNYLALVYVHRNMFDNSLKLWDKALEINPKDEFALINKGKTLIQLKKYKEALVTLNKAVELNEKNLLVYNLLGVVNANLNNLTGAIKAWKTVIDYGGDDEYLHLNLARALAENKEYKEALVEYNMLLELFPENHELHKVIQKTIKNIQKSIISSQKGDEKTDYISRIEEEHNIKIEVKPKKNKLNFEKIYKYLSDFEYMNKAILKIIFNKKLKEDFQYDLEKLILSFGEKSFKSTITLRSLMKKAIDIIPESEEGDEVQLKTIALAEEESVDETKLVNAIRRAKEMVEEEPDNEWAHYSLGSLLAQHNNFEEAIIHFENTAKINSNNAIALYALGLANVRLGKLEDGAAALKRAIISKPDSRLQAVYDEWNFKDSLAYFAFGDVLIRMSKFNEAIAVFKKGLTIDATSALAHFQLGTCYEVINDFPNAVTYLTNSLSLDPEFAYAYSKLGIVYYKTSKYSEAMAMLQKAAAYDTADGETFFYLGVTCEKLGKTHEARYAWDMVMKISPLDDVYYKKAKAKLNGVKKKK